MGFNRKIEEAAMKKSMFFPALLLAGIFLLPLVVQAQEPPTIDPTDIPPANAEVDIVLQRFTLIPDTDLIVFDRWQQLFFERFPSEMRVNARDLVHYCRNLVIKGEQYDWRGRPLTPEELLSFNDSTPPRGISGDFMQATIDLSPLFPERVRTPDACWAAPMGTLRDTTNLSNVMMATIHFGMKGSKNTSGLSQNNVMCALTKTVRKAE